MELPDLVLDGKLRVRRRLTGGEAASSWEVEDTRFGQLRALEVLHAHLTDRADVVDRFLRDACAAGRLGEPHLREIYEAGRLESHQPYLLMELLAGRSLGERLRYGARLQLPELAEIGRHACLGLEAAHAAGILHGDLTPESLLLTSVGGRLFVKVLGFGSSRFDELGPEDARLLPPVAAPFYMSPEQLSGLTALDPRTDVYALGVILYQAAAGRPPFQATSVGVLAVRIHEGRAPPLGELCPGLPEGFVAVVERAMHRDAGQRFSGARQLFDALAPYASQPPPPATVARRRSRLWPVLALVLPFALGALAFLRMRGPQVLPALPSSAHAASPDAGEP